MALLKREIAAQVCEHVCGHDAHGYSQPNRAGDGGTERIRLSDGSYVTIHSGDYDCSELVRMCYQAAGVLGGYWDSYLWTGNQDEVLRSHGFERVPLSSIVRGDVLWRSGHTALYLGGGLIGEAHHGDYAGGLSGRQGDQDGTEVRIAAYSAASWSRAYHYPESGGTDTSWEVFDVSKTVTVVNGDGLNIRAEPSRAGEIVGEYRKGDTVYIDGVVVNDSRAWGTYIGGSSGKRRYICLGVLEYAR